MPRKRADDELQLTEKLVNGLYIEAMTLADEARSYFDEDGKTDRESLGPIERVQFSCESLRVTTRLMHSVSWLMNRKAVAAGEISEAEGQEPGRRLGRAGEAVADPEIIAALPPRAQHVIEASRDIYERVKRLDETLVVEEVPLSPARQLFGKLETHF